MSDIKGRWFVTIDGCIFAGDENGKFPYVIYTQTNQGTEQSWSNANVRLKFSLLIDDRINPPSFSVINDKLVNLKGEVLGFVNVDAYSEKTKYDSGIAECEMEARFGGIIERPNSNWPQRYSAEITSYYDEGATLSIDCNEYGDLVKWDDIKQLFTKPQ